MGTFRPAIWSTYAITIRFKNGMCTHFLQFLVVQETGVHREIVHTISHAIAIAIVQEKAGVNTPLLYYSENTWSREKL